MRMGLLQASQMWMRGESTFSPIRLTGWSQERRSMGAGGPRSSVVKVGASRDEMSQSWSSVVGYVSFYYYCIRYYRMYSTPLWCISFDVKPYLEHLWLIQFTKHSKLSCLYNFFIS